MSAGTRIYPVRLDDALMVEVRSVIASRNLWTREEPWRLAHFVRVAIIEKLAKVLRGRKRRSRPTVTAAAKIPDA